MAAKAELTPREPLGIASRIGRYGDDGGNVPDQSKFAKKPRPKISQHRQKCGLLFVHRAEKDNERAIFARGKMLNEIPVRSVGGKSRDLQPTRCSGRLDDGSIVHYLVSHDHVEVMQFEKFDKVVF